MKPDPRRLRRRGFLRYTGTGLLGGVGPPLSLPFLPFGPREKMEFDDPQGKSRSKAEADEQMAATGTPWATDAALDILDDGGNAVDAAVGALLMINVTFGEAASFPGVAPVVVYDSEADEYRSYTGAGTAPGKATIEQFRSQGYETMPSLSIESQLLPASPDVAVELLKEHGTMSFGDVVEPATTIAREGFPVHNMMLHNLDQSLLERFGFYLLMPYNVKVYLGGQWWRPLHHSERFRRTDLAETFERLAEAERSALEEGGSREDGLEAVRREFYEGEIAERIVEFHDDRGGLFTREDLAGYEGYWEEPVTGSYGEYKIHTNSFWSQAPVVPMVLQTLEGVETPQSPEDADYAHTVLQAIDLAMADRDTYMGDPEHVDVPAEGLLSKEYAEERRSEMTPDSNFADTPEPGNPREFSGDGEGEDEAETEAGAQRGTDSSVEVSAETDEEGRYHPDTSYLSVVDSEGNAVSMTPSDFPMTPMVPGTGLTLGNRMTQFRLDPDHPSSLEPGKRPRITPHAVMVSEGGDFRMSFGTPGGDTQTQALVQVFLNTFVFGMDIQEAIEAPRFVSANFPDSFSPHDYSPGTVEIERSLYDEIGDGLEEKGYELDVYDDWADGDRFGGVCAVKRVEDGSLTGGADPRLESWAAGDSSRYF